MSGVGGGGVGGAGGSTIQSLEKALHSPMPFTTGGQTITDRLQAAKHSLAGSQLGKSICKATTEECLAPKKKHLDYLLHCTHEPNVSIPQMANLLIERTQNTNWCVVYKSLITIHNIMCYGNERFTQYLASCNCNFTLNAFLDKGSAQGYDMSTHVRRYAKYITEKIATYRLMAFDFCKVKRGREDGLLRTMHTDKLLKTLPPLQQQIDALLEFQVSPGELTNGVINSCFILLFRDLIRLFACYNDGVINLLEKYFDMNKKQCRDALDLYKVFLVRMDKVAEFLKVAETVGIDRGEIPDLAKAPGSLLNALEQHLASLEGREYVPPPPVMNQPTTAESAIRQLNSMTDPTAVDASRVDEQTKLKYLQQEQQQMEALKQQRLREMEMHGGGFHRPPPMRSPAVAHPPDAAFNPFLNGAASSSQQAPPGSKPFDDLMSMEATTMAPTNPFASFQNPAMPTPPMAAQQPSPMHPPHPPPPQFGNQFAPDFSAAFAAAHQQPPPPRPQPAFGSGDTSAFQAAQPTPGGANNPFLTEGAFDDTDLADDAWAQAAAASVHTVGSAVSNPFSALQQNAAALDQVNELQLAPPSAGMFGGASGATTPVSPQPPAPTPVPYHQQQAASAGIQPPSGTASPVTTMPMAINRPDGGHQLGIYDQTPFAGGDASYTSSPQIHRHMMEQQQQQQQQQPFDAIAGDLSSFDSFAANPFGAPSSSTAAGGKTTPLDLDSTLANLAQNLTIDKSHQAAVTKPIPWGQTNTQPANINWSANAQQPTSNVDSLAGL